MMWRSLILVGVIVLSTMYLVRGTDLRRHSTIQQFMYPDAEETTWETPWQITTWHQIGSTNTAQHRNTDNNASRQNEKVINTETVTLLAGGDMMLSRTLGRYLQNRDHSLYSTGESKVFLDQLREHYCYDSSCIRFFNLESLFSSNPNNSPEASFSFRADKKNERVLREIQGSQHMIVNIANNHTRDVSGSDIDMTYTMIESIPQRIAIGAWSKQFMKQPQILEVNDIRICANGYSYDGGALHNSIDMNTITQDLATMKQIQKCDIRIISLHRWREYVFAPTQEQRDIAYQIADQWADIILGHHSHVPGDIERRNDTLIFYSLGNFIFDQNRWFRNAPAAGFDTIFDHTVQRPTVPTYIGLLPAIHIQRTILSDGSRETSVYFNDTQLHMAQFNMGRRTQELSFGNMTFAHPRTRREIIERIWKME